MFRLGDPAPPWLGSATGVELAGRSLEGVDSPGLLSTGQDLAMATPVIIEVAINGGTTKAANPNVPRSPDEIAGDALACLDAGAAIVHVHCDPVSGPDNEVAERYLAGFRPVWAARPDALLYPTINFGAGGLSFGHLPILAEAGLRIGLLDPGSVNLGRLGPDGLPVGAFVYANSFDRVGEVFAMHRDLGLGPSLAIYEPGFLRATLAWWRKGMLPAGSMIKLYLSEQRGLGGSPFGLPVTPTALDAYLEILGDCDVPWAVSAVGGDLVRSPVAKLALERGGHLHIGLEFYGGERTPTNLELVQEAVALCATLGRPVATCAQAAEILGLPRGTG
jgi:3-keto-5-aminohexanoate cleavage enzyme